MIDQREIAVLHAYRTARTAFFRSVIAAAKTFRESTGQVSLSEEEIEALSSDNVYNVGELYYLFRAADYRHDADAFETYLLRHSADLEAKKADIYRSGPYKNLRTPDGLSLTRIEGGILTDRMISSLVQTTRRFAGQNGLMLDQAKLASLLTEVMSPETCRTTVLLLADCGFLDRTGSSPVTVTSNDKLENLFSAYLSSIANQLELGPRRVETDS